MKLNKLINTNLDIDINSIKTNSKDIEKGDIFVCTLGTLDKTKYIEDAINKGCSVIITDKDIKIDYNIIKVDNIDKVLLDMLNKYYDYPLKDIKLIGVTGTDGKTSTVSILSNMTDCASIGTNGFIYRDKIIELNNTTPSLDKLFYLFNIARNNNIKYIFMEVSSESYLTNRIPGLKFDIGVLTNITVDHLDKHKTFDNYFKCKMEVFKNSKYSIINSDCNYYNDILNYLDSYSTYGNNGDIKLVNYELFSNYTNITFSYNNQEYHIKSSLIGIYNVYNLLCSIMVLLALKFDLNDIIERINNIKNIRGRNEYLYDKDFKIVIDHAHTFDATKNIIDFFNSVKENRLIVILGCAGGRYIEKRSIIGNYVLNNSDLVIFTEDDPRDESVDNIIDDMINNSKNTNYLRINNRYDAILKGINLATKNDIILILGRGRDNIMHRNNEDIIFSDYDTVLEITNSLK